MATHVGGAGTPTTTQQESQAPTTDPILQSLLTSVRLLDRKVSHILGRQSELEADLEANVENEMGFSALEQLHEQQKTWEEEEEE